MTGQETVMAGLFVDVYTKNNLLVLATAPIMEARYNKGHMSFERINGAPRPIDQSIGAVLERIEADYEARSMIRRQHGAGPIFVGAVDSGEVIVNFGHAGPDYLEDLIFGNDGLE